MKGLGLGLLGGIAGLVGMRLAQRLVAPIVKPRAPGSEDVFVTESSSLFGWRHGPDEAANEALARIAYEKLLHRAPSARTKQRLAWFLHVGYGLLVASIHGALRSSSRHVIRSGAVFGVALWLLGDELAMPLLGLSEKPTAYSPTRHLQSLAAHLGYGVATVATTQALRRLT
jgi:hypothetical protein